MFDHLSPHRDLELEDSKSIFLHDTRVHDGASPYQVWLQKLQRLRRYRWVEHSLECLTVPVTLTLTTTEQSNLFTRQSSSWLGAIKPIYFSCERISNSETYHKSSLVTWSSTLTLTLKTANQYFWKTVWLMLMHHRTKFGSIRFSISEDSIWINSHWHFAIFPWPWPWTQQSNFFIRQSGWW